MHPYSIITKGLALAAVLMLAAALVLIFGCSSGGGLTGAPVAKQPLEVASSGLDLGHFRIVLDEDAWKLRIEPALERHADWDVTKYAEFSIASMWWDAANRNWHITVNLKNPTMLTGYGVWAVFTELGKKEIVRPDGFIYTPPPGIKRVPVVAFAKDQPQRAFPPMHTDSRIIIIHWPEDVHNWIPVEFYVDAAWPKARKMPVVEDLEITQQSGFSCVYSIVAYVEDWQEPGETLEVWADLSAMNGGLPSMFDDGEHGDGGAGDNIFGGFFLDNAPEPAMYTATVYAVDPAGHSFENDVKHFFTGGVPAECFDYTVLAEGSMGKIHEFQQLAIEDQPSFEEYWEANFGTTSGMPIIDFDTERVIAINMGGCPCSGHYIEIDRICVDPWVDCLCIDVDYIRHHPGDWCITLPVTTSPYWIGSIPRTVHALHFFGMDYVYKCPDSEGSLKSWPVTKGHYSDIINFGEYFIDNQADWEAFWDDLTGLPGSIPEIDFAEYAVVSVVMGVQERGMHFPDLRRVLYDTSQHVPVYKACYAYVTPKDECYSVYIPTVPYGIWKIEKPGYPLYFDRYDQEMTCK